MIPELEVLLPVHNEAESIEATVRELYTELSKLISVGFIVCEDGSHDNTKEILRRLAQEIPIRLNLSGDRKGYSKAVREGMQMLEAEWLLCVDSDGQCAPKDFPAFWKVRDKADVLLGWRVDRQDTFVRRTMSRLFYLIYQTVFHTPVHDPSCPYVLCRKAVAHSQIDHLRDIQFMLGPIDSLDHSARLPNYGSKMGIDATRKWKAEGFDRPWPAMIEMDRATKARVDELWTKLGL
jgi:glycosyltransferase involved in cell wall biosynthesis